MKLRMFLVPLFCFVASLSVNAESNNSLVTHHTMIDTTITGRGYGFSVEIDSVNQKHYYVSIHYSYRVGAIGIFEQETKYSYINQCRVVFELKDKSQVVLIDSNLICKMYTTDPNPREYSVGARPKFVAFVFKHEVDRTFIENCSKGNMKSCTSKFSIVEKELLDFEMINPLFLNMLDKDLDQSSHTNKTTHIGLMYTYFHVNYVKKDTTLERIDSVAFKNKIKKYVLFKTGKLNLDQMNFGKTVVKNGTADLRLKDKKKNFMLKSSEILLIK